MNGLNETNIPTNVIGRDRVALLLVDLQNEFASLGGKLNDSVKDVMSSNGMLDNIKELVQNARDAGALVIHSPVVMKESETFKNETNFYYTSLRGVFTEGTWNSQFIDEIQPRRCEIVLRGRRNYCAFEGTELFSALKRNGVKTFIIAGFMSNICIQETALAAKAKMQGMQVICCSDGSATTSMQEHNQAMATLLDAGVDVMRCREALDKVREHQAFQYNYMEMNGPESPMLSSSRRLRILALHGAQSNNEVTLMQLKNIGITHDDHDIVCMSGSIQVEEGHPSIESLVRGPFYSWFNHTSVMQDDNIIASVRNILTLVQNMGPFDGVYGFSNGAAMALLVAGIASDPGLRAKIYEAEKREKEQSSENLSSSSKVQKREGIFDLESALEKEFEFDDLVIPPFEFVFLSHAATPFKTVAKLRHAAGLFNENVDMGTFDIPSFHIMGIEDDVKDQGEDISRLFSNRKVMYIPGGHGISREERNDTDLVHSIRDFLTLYRAQSEKSLDLNYRQNSEVSQMALLPHKQVAIIKLDQSKLPWRKKEGATIISELTKWPEDKPFLRESRNDNASQYTAYGDVVKFIQGGQGDLRHIGVKPGEVVAYAAPPGGSAAAALAFLTIGAQTVAAPIAPNTSEADTLDTLDQFHAKHMILFEGVSCPGVEAGFKKYEEMGNAKLHKATILGKDKPGMFEFIVSDNTVNKKLSEKPLKNEEGGTCLLLRTSGTTARPKGVPLRQEALVVNGAILAASMQLREDDVCYSVMPLFHIGGISASIMCTVSSGGSVCCDSEPFDPSRMVKALAVSRPQPTWYSSVPTIHNATVAYLKEMASSDPEYTAYGIASNGIWKSGHSLRMIRSGAAALLGPDGETLAAAYGNVPVFPTYSMSEQMPISQPPAGYGISLTDKPGSVGMPVAASMAIVSRSTLRPVAYGEEGEIAISGPTVMKKYLENPDADRKSYFELTLDSGSNIIGDDTSGGRYFLTGDIGTIDSDGFLSLKGRAKELIKKGGEQVSPYEVEEPLKKHPWVEVVVCFSVPSKLYGEEVGCAIVLSYEAPPKVELREVTTTMRSWLKQSELAPTKWPTKWIVVNDDDLPKTKTKKYIRIDLSTKLSLDPKDEEDAALGKNKDSTKAKVDWECIGGLRFFLACYVMFMHFGSNESWGKVNNLRGFPWHVHMFFSLGGYSLASPMNPTIRKKFAYFKARIWSMYPMYMVALVFGLANLLVVCRPSTFDPNFHWNSQPDDKSRAWFCEGTPATPNSYWGSLFLTIIVYILGAAVTPTFLVSWWMGYYLWFSSMYYQCLAFFPAMYNLLYNRAKNNVPLLLQIIGFLFLLNALISLTVWFIVKDADNYLDDYDKAKDWNIAGLSFYLVGPFWALYFIVGMTTAFLYDAYRPTERHDAWKWGVIADSCSVILIALSFAHVFQDTSIKYMRPVGANQMTDTAIVNRVWDNIYARLFCPLTTLWIFALSTGQGHSVKFFSSSFLSKTLAPHSYNCFLFHQMVGQWYYAATRNGEWWNWWAYRKTMYWFSPGPCPVEWYEYFELVGFVVAFSHLITTYIEPVVNDFFDRFIKKNTYKDDEEVNNEKVILRIIEDMTGIEAHPSWTLEECGLASIGVPVLVTLLNKNFSQKGKELSVTAADLVAVGTIADMVAVVDEAMKQAEAQGV